MGLSSIAKKVASNIYSIGKKVVKGGIVLGGIGIGALHHLGKKEIAKEAVRTAEIEKRNEDTKKMMEDAEKAKPNYNPFMKKVDGTYASVDEVVKKDSGIERKDSKDKVVGGVVDVAKGTAGVVGGVGKVGLGVVGGTLGGIKKITPNPLKKKNP